MIMAKIIVACGSGVATSQTVASKINRLLKEKKINSTVDAVDIKSLDNFIKDADVYVSIVRTNKKFTIPVINGIAFLTGMGQDKEFEKLVDAIKKADAKK
ncbi:PTS galactitol transporter subunit IIB [Sporolactobacillus laevolacticus DSM 442]|uniref:PTS galactitol transporter subunit IIB n=2 Tax=Sporolactobacillus laevolacticus TaxID=33018 RepID=V6IZ18_9BACL|nr:PTS galactitol transporter subunit IIB [Sporolactobacillus laevolacticus DSM 442]